MNGMNLSGTVADGLSVCIRKSKVGCSQFAYRPLPELPSRDQGLTPGPQQAQRCEMNGLMADIEGWYFSIN